MGGMSPVVDSLMLTNDTGTSGDNITTDPTLNGQIAYVGDLMYLSVEVDTDGDLITDDTATVDWMTGDFSYTPDNLSPGTYTISVRGSDDMMMVTGGWSSITFTLEEDMPGMMPEISSLQLSNDTDTPGDLYTTDPSINGQVSYMGDIMAVMVEVDWNGDQIMDDYASYDPMMGTFSYTPSALSPGYHTISVRAVDDMMMVTGEWSSISFTLEEEMTGMIPEISSLQLTNDTDTPGDLITTDPTINGQVSYMGDLMYVSVEVDVDGDQISDGSATYQEWDGTFSYSPSGLSTGTHTISFRAVDSMSMIEGAWSSITFTLEEEMSGVEPEISTLQLTNDTDTPEDNITSDPAINGQVSYMGDLMYVAVEVDLDGDFISDAPASFNEMDGTFSYTPGSLSPGYHTLSVRAVDNMSMIEGQWTSISFELVSEQPLLPTVEDDAFLVEENSSSVVISVLDNDLDPYGTGLTITSVSSSGSGIVSIQSGSPDSILYQPPVDFTGTEIITYTVTDGGGETGTGTLTITVHENDDTLATARTTSLILNTETTIEGSIGDGPQTDLDVDLFQITLSTGQMIVADLDAAYLDDGSAYSALDGYLRLFDASGNELIFNDNANDPNTSVSSSDSLIRFTADVAGTYYLGVSTAVNNDYDSTTSGSGVASSGGKYKLQLTLEENSRPVAVDDSFVMDENTTASIDILANDSDPDGPGFFLSAVSEPLHGNVQWYIDGVASELVVEYTPDTDFTGIDTFTYTIEDVKGATSTATVTMSVYPDLNLGGTKSFEINADTKFFMGASTGVLEGVNFELGTTLTVTLETTTANGTLILNENGSFIYTPDSGFSGTDQFDYKIMDGSIVYTTGTIVLNVVSMVAVDDSVSTPKNSRIMAGPAFTVEEGETPVPGLLENDQFGADSITYAELISGPAHGDLTLLDDGSYLYYTDTNYAGTDSFTYQLVSGTATSAPATVTINILNEIPQAVNDVYTISHDRLLSSLDLIDSDTGLPVTAEGVLANDLDADGDYLAASLVTTTTNGTLTFNSLGQFVYSPNSGFTGTDSFTYTISDGVNESNLATVTINVVNSTPVASDDSYTISHDQTLTVGFPEITTTDENGQEIVVVPYIAGLIDNDSDADEDTLDVISTTLPTNGTLTWNSDGSFSYTPNSGFTGTDQFQYQLTDGITTSNTATVVIDVTNEAPVAVDDSYTFEHDSILYSLPPIDDPMDGGAGGTGELPDNWIVVNTAISNDQDADDDPLEASLVSNVTSGTLVFNPDGSYMYTPNVGFVGTDQFTYQITDGSELSNIATVTFNVTNSIPVAGDDNYQMLVGKTLVGGQEDLFGSMTSVQGLTSVQQSVLVNDTDGNDDDLTTTLVTGPSHGVLTFRDDGHFIYTPDQGFIGTDSFTYQVTDGMSVSNIATAVIDITNDAPVATDDSYSLQHDVTATFGLGVLFNDTDADNQELTAILVAAPVHGTLDFFANGTFTYTPDAGYVGTDTFTYKVSDGTLESSIANVTLDITNDTPTGNSETFNVANNVSLNVGGNGGGRSSGVLANDGDSLDFTSAVLVSGPSNGTIDYFNENGTFSYTPEPGFTGTVSFTYQVSDGITQSDPITVNINVGAEDPDASGDLDEDDDRVNETAAEYDAALKDMGSTLASISQTLAAAYNESAAIQDAEVKAATEVFLTAMNAAQETYQTEINNIEAAYKAATDANNENYEQEIAQANSDYNASMAAISKTYNDAIDAANQTYESAVAASDLTYTNAAKQASDTYQTQLSSLDATYDTAIADSYQAQSTAMNSINNTYQASEQAAYSTFLASRTTARQQYDTDLAQSRSTLDAVLANHPNTTYNPGLADSDASYISALNSALAGIQSTISSAAATYQSAVDQAMSVYNSAIDSAAVDYADAVAAADTAQTAAYAAADASYDAAAAAAQATYDTTVTGAADTRDADIQSAQSDFNTQEAALAATRDQAIQTAQDAYDSAVDTANAAHNSAVAGIDQTLANNIQMARDDYDAAIDSAAADYNDAMGPATQQYANDIAGFQTTYDQAKANAKAALNAAQDGFSGTYDMGVAWLALITVEQNPYSTQEEIWEARKIYSLAEAQNKIDYAILADSSNNTYVNAERSAFLTFTNAVAPRTLTFAYKQADENKINADAKLDADEIFYQDTTDDELVASVQKQQAYTALQLALASAKKTFEDAKADATHAYNVGLAGLQNTLDFATIAAETVYEHEEINASKTQQLALTAAGEQLQLDYANADVAWVQDTAAAEKAFSVASNNAYASLANAVLTAQLPYITTVLSANASAVGVVASARAAAIINASGGDPDVAAVANAYAAYQTSQASLRSIQLTMEATAEIMYAHAEVSAWMLAANAAAGQVELQANAAAAAGLDWVTDEAAAYRAMADANIDAATTAAHNEADAVANFNFDEADQRMAASISSAGSDLDRAKKAALAELDHSNTHWPEELTRFQQAANKEYDLAQTEITETIKKLRSKLASETKKMKEDAKTNEAEAKKAAAKDKNLAIKEAAKTGAQGVKSAKEAKQIVAAKPLSDFEYGPNGVAIGFEFISPALDNTVNFMTGWANALTAGGFTNLLGDEYLRYVDYQSSAYQGGQVVGAIHGFLLGGAAGSAHVGWAYTVARGYSAATSAVGLYETSSKIYNGEELDVWDYLNVVPAAGWLGGKLTGGLGIFRCFVGDTQVVLAEEAPGGFQAQVGLTPEEGEGIEVHEAGAGLLVIIGIAGAGAQLARKRRKQKSGFADLDRLFERDAIDNLMSQTSRSSDVSNSQFLDHRQTNPQFALLSSGKAQRKDPSGTSPQVLHEPSCNPSSTPVLSTTPTVSTEKGNPMPDRRQPAASQDSKLSRYAGPFSWLTIFCLLAVLLFSFGGSHSDAESQVNNISPQMQVTDTPIKHKTLDIKDVQLGERLLGKNPIEEEVDDFVPEINPREWRLLYLTMEKANGKRLDMQFLRPVEWMKANDAQLGATINLDLPEFGAQGAATVVSIESCPQVKVGAGNVVTGKFIHQSDGNLIDLKIEGQQESTTVTANHRYWSADRDKFVEAGHLNPGEQVQTLAGLKQVLSITLHPYDETVYNLEVQGEHVYQVGTLGTLVHNNYPVLSGLDRFSKASDYGIDTYNRLKTLTRNKGLQVHHLIEKRFAGILGVKPGSMKSIVLTKAEHQEFTNAWRRAVPYGTTGSVDSKGILGHAREIYADFPDILDALGL